VSQPSAVESTEYEGMSTDLEPDRQSRARPPVNVYTAMLLLSFVAISLGCLMLALELFSRRLPLSP
jgi:hypothetical protein